MLKLIKLHSKNQVWEHFQSIDIESESWIVSKASDREIMSQHLLRQNGYFLDLNIQWHRMFFQMLFERTFPEFKIVSREFSEAFLKRKMQNFKSDLAIDLIDEKSRLRSMTYFAPLLFDQDLDERKLEEWLSESDERKLRLKPDLLLNRLFLSFFLDSKIICEDWIVAHLQTADLSDIQLPHKKLYFDLGIDYGLQESTVLRKLAAKHDVTLFQVAHSFDSSYSHLVQAYERFDKIENISKEKTSSPTIELKKFSSAVSETRFAIGQIKEWLGQEIALNEMAVVAPDIRKYADVLSWLLLAEGISVNQGKKSSFLEFQDIREVISDLSFFKKNIEFPLVRESLIRFCTEEKAGPFHRWEEKLNSPFLSADQFLERVDSCFPSFYRKHFGLTLEQVKEKRMEELDVAEFVKSAKIIWERTELGERKEKIIKALFDLSSPTTKLRRQEWCEQIEEYAKNLQVNIGPKEADGIQLLSLNQVSLHHLKKVFVVGLDESGFQSQFKESIPTEDIFKLGNELGVYLQHPDFSVNGFLLEDLISQVNQAVLSYPYKDIESSLQNPAPQWQNRAFEQELIEKEMDQPLPTRWQHLISNPDSHWLDIRHQEYKLDFLAYDLKAAETPGLTQFSLSEISLSPSSVKTFLDCTQKFYFQRVLKLKSIESESFDINAREKGSWYHLVFEKVIQNEDEFIRPWLAKKMSDSDKAKLALEVQSRFADIVPTGFSESMWDLLRKSYFENVVKFIQHEVDLRTNFPELKSIAVEWDWTIFYDWKTFEFGRVAGESTVKIAGKIDRIFLNQHTNQLWVIDYKSNVKNFSGYKSWIDKKEFQLLLYNEVIQHHSAEPWASKVENLSYWQLPDMRQKKGFASSDVRLKEIGFGGTSVGTMDEKEKVEAEFRVQFQEMIIKMKRGKFSPEPSEEKHCRNCEWRLGCRAPHL